MLIMNKSGHLQNGMNKKYTTVGEVVLGLKFVQLAHDVSFGTSYMSLISKEIDVKYAHLYTIISRFLLEMYRFRNTGCQNFMKNLYFRYLSYKAICVSGVFDIMYFICYPKFSIYNLMFLKILQNQESLSETFDNLYFKYDAFPGT